MNRRNSLIAASVILILAGCTVHPAGEREERQNALSAGKPYESPDDSRVSPSLPDHPTPGDLVRYALLTNADLEQQYWQWRSAIEQIPIDGTQATNLAISLGTTLNNGAFALDRTTIGAGNDPMTDIVLPSKLSAAAQRSLENAKAAGMRFRRSQFELRRKVLAAYDDFALSAELIRLGEENINLLQMTATITAAGSRSGLAAQQDLLKAENDLDLAKNDVASMRSQLPVQQAALNDLLNRSPDSPIPVPDRLPPIRPVPFSDQQLLDRAAKVNPQLLALADELRAKQGDIRLAKLQYDPDFSISASTDLQGVAQSLLGQFTVPILRYEALHAAVEQSEANLRAEEAMRRQASNDLAAQLIDDIATVRDADRQLDLLKNTILPRARQAVTLARTAYQTGNASLLDMLESQRSLIEIERLIAILQTTRDKRLAEIESINAASLEPSTSQQADGAIESAKR
jgi:outer membrane protein, heavy metal efflux system